MLMKLITWSSPDQNVGRSQNIETDNSSFERVEQFKYLGTSLTNQNFIRKEIKTRKKSGSACYNLVQNRLCSSLLSKNVKIQIYRTIILPVVWYGCETWSLTLREEHRLRVEYVEIKCQLNATEVFIADLIACSTCLGHHYAHHQELKSIIQ